jgi:hypothetical protein
MLQSAGAWWWRDILVRVLLVVVGTGLLLLFKKESRYDTCRSIFFNFD